MKTALVCSLSKETVKIFFFSFFIHSVFFILLFLSNFVSLTVSDYLLRSNEPLYLDQLIFFLQRVR